MVTINDTQGVMLGLFGEESLTGSDVMTLFKRYMEPYWSVTRSQVYRELPTLHELGLLAIDKTRPSYRGSQHYVITQAGKAAFKSWLNRPVKNDILRYDLAARIAFADNLSNAELAKIIDAGIENARRELVKVQNMRKAVVKNGLDWDALSLRLSEMQIQTTLRWLTEVKKKAGK